MGLISKTVKIKWDNSNKKYYEAKGYKFTKNKDEFEVKVEDLPDGSHALVEVSCDCPDCTTPIDKPVQWVVYLKRIYKYEKYYCSKCARKIYGTENIRKAKLKNGESFGYWLIKNLPLRQAIEIILRWDDEKNSCDIRDIGHSSHGINNKGYWFKCLNHTEHESELKNINHFTKSSNENLNCNQCNSIGQYILDTYGENGLRDYWDYEKNDKLGLEPFKIAKNTHTKVYMFCQIHKYHGSYIIACTNFTSQNQRCPYCCNSHGKVHPLDSLGQYIIDNYGKEFLDKIWSEKNEKSAFEYTPMSMEKVYWKCLDEKHNDYYRDINSSNVCEFRCPECANEQTESIFQEKTRLYLEENYNYKILHEKYCTLKPKNIIEPPNNSNKKRGKGMLRYDNEIIINNNHLFIEVMGQQHDTLDNYYNIKPTNTYKTTPKQELEYLQAKDKYKEDYVYQQGSNYHYLAVWYYHFNKENTYKKLIKNKISEILNNY